MKKYLLICMLFISNAFCYESYYEKAEGMDKIVLDVSVKRCINGSLAEQKTITDEDLAKAKLLCQELLACVVINFGITNEPTDAQMRYCFDKIKEIVK